MPNKHVVIIGAGIVGVCAALHLQRAGFKVTLVDRQAPGEATSFGNACMITDSSIVPIPGPGIVKTGIKTLLDPDGPLFIRPGYAPRLAPWLWRFVRQGRPDRVQHSAAALASLLRGARREHHELADNTPAARWLGDEPSLLVYHSRQDFDREAKAWTLKREHGIAFETIDRPEQLRELEPALSPRFRFAIKMPDHGRALNPSKLVKAHADWLQRGGGVFLQRQVRAIERVDNRPRRLLTDHDPIDFDTLVIAAGPWSAKLSGQLGDAVPLESEGGYHITLTDAGVRLNHALMSTRAKVAIADMEQGIRFAGMVEFAGLNAAPVPDRSRLLLNVAAALLPQARRETYTEWRGNRPTLPDSLPVIGPSRRYNNIYYAFGHQHVGLSSGPKTGRLISQLVAGQRPAVDVSPFRVDRF